MSGFNTYTSLNQSLMVCGFEPLRVPPHPWLPKPSFQLTDLIDCGTYSGEVRFNIWLPLSYEFECICQVWIKLIKSSSHSYIRSLVPISASPTEVVIDKTRVRKDGCIVEENLSSFKKCKLRLHFVIEFVQGNLEKCFTRVQPLLSQNSHLYE